VYAAGPRPDPCMMLAVTSRKEDTSPPSLVQYECPLKNLLSSCTPGPAYQVVPIFPLVEWHTESKAFEKYKAITCTKLLVAGISHTVWSRATSAAVVEPDGLNAYWSEKHNDGGGWSRAG